VRKRAGAAAADLGTIIVKEMRELSGTQTGDKDYKGIAVRGSIGLSIALSFSAFAYTSLVILRTPICAALSYDEASFSLFFSLYFAGYMLVNLMMAKMIAKMGVKRVAIIGSLSPIVGMTVLVLVPNFVVAMIDGFVFGFMNAMVLFVTYNIYVSSWFSEGQGKMMSIASIGMNILMSVGAPIVASLSESIDIRTLTVVLGVVLSAIAIVGCLFVSGLPSDYGCGQVALAGDKKQKEHVGVPVTSSAYDPVMPTGKLIGTAPVLASLLGAVFLSIGLTMFATNPIQIYMAYGVDMVAASLCMSVSTIAGVLVVSTFGVVNDRIGTRNAILVYTALDVVMIMVSLLFMGWTGAIICAVFTYFVQYYNMYSGLVMPQVVGAKRAPQFIGYVGMLQGAAGVAAPLVGMAIFNATGTYRALIPACAALYVLTALCALLALGSKAQDVIKRKDEPYAAAVKEEGTESEVAVASKE
jgi:MFS family permease